LAATAARANSGASANGIDACIGVVGGCAPNGAGYVLGGIQMYGEQGYAYEHPYETHRRDGGYPNGY
jgi:hypothetical protein